MLEYDRTDVLEGTDINKRNVSKECDTHHCWYLNDIGYTFEPYVYNGYHDLMLKALSFNDVIIVSIKRSNYRIHMSKDDAINLAKNSDLKKWIIIIYASC